MRNLTILCIVFAATVVSAYMTVNTIHERDALMWKDEQHRELAVFMRLKYNTLERKYREQEKLLNTCRGN